MAKFIKGVPRPAGSGRQKGSLNKRTRTAAEALETLGFNGLVEMYKMWKEPMIKVVNEEGVVIRTEGTSEQGRVKLLCELTQYQFPKLTATQYSGPTGGPVIPGLGWLTEAEAKRRGWA